MNEKEIIDSFVVPDSVEPIVGWRAWSVEGRPWEGTISKLQSPAHRVYWEPRQPLTAWCRRSITQIDPRFQTVHSLSVPVKDCTCGIYITDNKAYAAGYGHIIGEVYGWGRVVEHKKGWRVQYAYPKSIYTVLPYEFEDYGVPVHHLTMNEWAELTSWSDREAARFKLLCWQFFGKVPDFERGEDDRS